MLDTPLSTGPTDPATEALKRLRASIGEREALVEERKAIVEALDKKAEAIIWTNTLANAGFGVVPIGINMLTFIGANATTIVSLGYLYGYTLSKEQAATLIRQIFMSVGLTWGMLTLGGKVFIELAKVLGLATAGSVTALAMGFDGVLCAALSHAIGYTAKRYFIKDCQLTKAEMGEEFKRRFGEGKQKAKEEVKRKMNHPSQSLITVGRDGAAAVQR
jgi:uncharacterized protein (DUF697 family)